MSSSHSVLLSVSYLGTDFAGWAPQPGQRTIAGTLLDALRQLDPSIAEVRGVSRTDAGVHALDQRVAFDPTRDIPNKGWVRGPGPHLPDTISVTRAASVPRGFVPRFNNVKKRYRYGLWTEPVRSPFVYDRSWHVPELQSVERMREEAVAFVGEHDFRAYRSASDTRENTRRSIESCTVEERSSGMVDVVVVGDGFMHNMVRIMVGTLVDVALGRLAPGAVRRALEQGVRSVAGRTAPACGLTLDRVWLDDEGRDAYPT